MKKKYYIGLANSVHDSACAIVNSEGKVVFAEASERYMQNKRAVNISPDIFFRCRELISKYAKEAEEFYIGYSWSDEKYQDIEQQIKILSGKEQQFRKCKKYANSEMIYQFAYGKFLTYAQQQAQLLHGNTFEYEIREIPGFEAEVTEHKGWPHHLTHAVTGIATSDMEKALCVIIDGYGEKGSIAVYEYDSKKERIEDILIYDSKISENCTGSLGKFYSLLCRLCKFDPLRGEEWKVMGMACYGEINNDLLRILSRCVKEENGYIIECGEEELIKIINAVDKIVKENNGSFQIRADLAHTGQYIYEECLFAFLNDCFSKHNYENLIMGGGCALNSTANGKILSRTPFKKIHIYSAPADDGCAIGAALLSYYSDQEKIKMVPCLGTPYLGSHMPDESVKLAYDFAPVGKAEYLGEKQSRAAAEYLAEGKIIAWVNGRAEFGPRALGNRSILANPGISGMKDRINKLVKRREEFRPFAPAILEEYGNEYFEDFSPTPYMEKTLHFRDKVKHKVPAVVHVDGTGRLQTIHKKWNPQFYEMIQQFSQLTGIPLILNTSFNVMGKPIVHSVEDALGVFYTSGIDALFIEGYCFTK